MRTTLHIADMHAVHAARGVFTALSAIEGIHHLDIKLGTVTLDHDGRATREGLTAALDAAGYKVVQFEEDARQLSVSRDHADTEGKRE